MGNNKNKPQITVVDQTMREGMQFMGLMFSHDERMQILKFQEEAGVDITEAGYPPAHESERIHIHDLLKTAEKNHYHTRVSGLARAVVDDAASMIDSGLKLFHLHISVPKQINQNQNNQIDIIMQPVIDAIDYIRKKKPFSEIHISILDVGKTEPDILLEYADIFARKLEVNVLKLPDTSGMLTPNLFFKQVRAVADQIGDTQTRIGVHCHNDLGMANANTIMGVEAGATVIDVSALGIGERNGIGDLFIVGKCLAEQGYQLNLKVYNLPVFKSYYEFINFICVNQCGFQPLNYSTPFCAGIKTHVAGTHGKDQFGIRSGEKRLFLMFYVDEGWLGAICHQIKSSLNPVV